MFATFLSSFSIPLAPLLLVVLLLVGLALIVVLVAVFGLHTKVQNLTYPVYDYVVKEAHNKANRILEEAEEQSRALRAKAQIEASKLLSDRKTENEKLHEAHSKKIEEVTVHARELLEKQSQTMQDSAEGIAADFKRYATEAQKALGEESGLIKKAAAEESERIRQSLATLHSEAEQEYKALMAENHKQIQEELTREIQSVRDAIAAYKQDRFRLLDEQIISLVEDTAHIALNKSMSLEDHRDVVLAALDEAKREGIFGK